VAFVHGCIGMDTGAHDIVEHVKFRQRCHIHPEQPGI
jgi:hypothetical protein